MDQKFTRANRRQILWLDAMVMVHMSSAIFDDATPRNRATMQPNRNFNITPRFRLLNSSMRFLSPLFKFRYDKILKLSIASSITRPAAPDRVVMRYKPTPKKI